MSTQKKSKVQDTIESQQLNDRTIFLWGGVDDKTARHVVDRLLYLDSLNHDFIIGLSAIIS